MGDANCGIDPSTRTTAMAVGFHNKIWGTTFLKNDVAEIGDGLADWKSDSLQAAFGEPIGIFIVMLAIIWLAREVYIYGFLRGWWRHYYYILNDDLEGVDEVLKRLYEVNRFVPVVPFQGQFVTRKDLQKFTYHPRTWPIEAQVEKQIDDNLTQMSLEESGEILRWFMVNKSKLEGFKSCVNLNEYKNGYELLKGFVNYLSDLNYDLLHHFTSPLLSILNERYWFEFYQRKGIAINKEEHSQELRFLYLYILTLQRKK